MNPCQNNAVCLLEDNQTVCYCVPDYHGSLCELRYDDCEAKFAMCDNGGTCVDGVNSFTCSCPADYHGQTCTQYDPISTTVTERDTRFFSSSSASAPYFQSTFTTPYGKSDTPTLQDTEKLDTWRTEELTKSTTHFSTTEAGVSTVQPIEENTSFPSTTVKFLYSSSTSWTDDSRFDINRTSSSEEFVTAEAITFSSTEGTTNFSRVTIDEAALAVSSTDFSTSVKENMTMVITAGVTAGSTPTETFGNGTKTSTSLSSTKAEGIIDSSTLTTESFFDQNWTSGTSTSTERQQGGIVYNCTQEQCAYNVTCQNNSVEVSPLLNLVNLYSCL